MVFNCSFKKEDKRFRYRAAAIIIENDCVLFAGNSLEDYYYSIGGGVHIGEKAKDAVKREVFEETGIHYEVDRLAVVHENFFYGKGGTLDGLHCHEIEFFYLMKPKGNQELKSDSYVYGVKEEMKWIPIKELDKYKAFPAFLKDYLKEEHKEIVHIVTEENCKY